MVEERSGCAVDVSTFWIVAAEKSGGVVPVWTLTTSVAGKSVHVAVVWIFELSAAAEMCGCVVVALGADVIVMPFSKIQKHTERIYTGRLPHLITDQTCAWAGVSYHPAKPVHFLAHPI